MAAIVLEIYFLKEEMNPEHESVQLLGWGCGGVHVRSMITCGDLLLFTVGSRAFRCTRALRFRDYFAILNELVDYILLRLARAGKTCSDLTPSNKHWNLSCLHEVLVIYSDNFKVIDYKKKKIQWIYVYRNFIYIYEEFRCKSR